MSDNIYLTRNGKLVMKNTTLYFLTEEEKVELPIENIRNLYFFGSGSVSTKVLKEFQKRKIVLHFFGIRGDYIGTFYPKEAYISGEILIRQVKAYMDIEKRLTLARSFVTGAIKNINWICNRFNLGKIDEPNIEEALSIEQLMQKEGVVRRQFYNLIDTKLPNDFKIIKREIRPPINRGNAILSFLNSLVYTTVTSEIYNTHLNPSISYLHEPFERRFSLALDVSELFKPLLSERLLLKLCNLKMIDPITDFEDKEGVFLSKNGLKKIVSEFDKEINKTLKMKSSNKKVSIRELIRIELYKLEKDLLNISNYKPIVGWW
jgi:CRISPR-associated protein Cas1